MISATDGYSSTQCWIRVSYFNPNSSPVIIDSSFSLPFYSEVPSYVGRVIAFDYDLNQTLSYSIMNVTVDDILYDSVFQIDERTGDLYLNSTSVFYDEVECLILAIRVDDDGVPSLYSESLVPVCFTSPLSLPSDALSIESITIEENREPHICFPSVVTSPYPSLQSFQLSFYGDDSLFSLFNNGTVCVEQSLNYEIQSFYSIPVIVHFTSFPSLSSVVSISVYVIDISFL